ncbi:hypothetical protein [Streptomyces sp. JJ36]|uniref:hypothetical protein n=1 Tax=Streptomyces sp. JJ36 TaxID=2736645 RepID=UPI001F2FCB99|nr:hypothetical protein [Streptomyces sp. JJ36]MCF6524845.1 hypothetical protein [Streptomyces sp. JJ36]
MGVKYYYRLVYWKRRLVGVGRGRAASARARGRIRGARQGARPLLVFLVIVGLVLLVSALLGWQPFGGSGLVGTGL